MYAFDKSSLEPQTIIFSMIQKGTKVVFPFVEAELC